MLIQRCRFQPEGNVRRRRRRTRAGIAILVASALGRPSPAFQSTPKDDSPRPPSRAKSPMPADQRNAASAHPSSLRGPTTRPSAGGVRTLPPTTRPSSVDLRARLMELRLTPRAQGARGTCSIFTTCAAIEFAMAKQRGEPLRLSPEFVNWAAGQASGPPSDGNFFHNALAGFEKYGVCADSSMPYQATFDPKRAPSPDALAEARRIREESREAIAIRWIVPWVADRFGVNDEQFAEIQRVLAAGYPVAAGSGHSRLLVGYRDGTGGTGGVFLTQDSALNRFDEVTYEFVRSQVADVFWIEALGANASGARSR